MAKNELAMSEEDAFDLAELAGKDSGMGSENVSSQDISIPYLGVLQKGSPQVDDATPAYIPGARAGGFFNNVTGQIWPGREEALLIVPVYYERHVIEWVPRESGGGLVSVHPADTDLMKQAQPNEKGIPCLANGNLLVDTAQHYILYEDDESWQPAILSLKSTALKRSRLLNSLLAKQVIPGTQNPAPRWLYTWNMTSTLETKDTNTWFIPQFDRSKTIDKVGYLKARNIYESLKSGAAKPAASNDEIPF